MAKAPENDPTKDPEFQKVVRHFLTTPPKPHKSIGGKQEAKHKLARKSKPKPRGQGA